MRSYFTHFCCLDFAEESVAKPADFIVPYARQRLVSYPFLCSLLAVRTIPSACGRELPVPLGSPARTAWSRLAYGALYVRLSGPEAPGPHFLDVPLVTSCPSATAPVHLPFFSCRMACRMDLAMRFGFVCLREPWCLLQPHRVLSIPPKQHDSWPARQPTTYILRSSWFLRSGYGHGAMIRACIEGGPEDVRPPQPQNI